MIIGIQNRKGMLASLALSRSKVSCRNNVRDETALRQDFVIESVPERMELFSGFLNCELIPA